MSIFDQYLHQIWIYFQTNVKGISMFALFVQYLSKIKLVPLQYKLNSAQYLLNICSMSASALVHVVIK